MEGVQINQGRNSTKYEVFFRLDSEYCWRHFRAKPLSLVNSAPVGEASVAVAWVADREPHLNANEAFLSG
jgi:hypothetical protein